MPGSKFGRAPQIQQPPPVCKKGPPKNIYDFLYPPTHMYCAFTWNPTPITSDQFVYANIIPISKMPPSLPWHGSLLVGDLRAIVEFRFHTIANTWSIQLDINDAGGGGDSAFAANIPYKGPIPFATRELHLVGSSQGGQFITKVYQ